jgi:O-antigen/teichoic acid export membrane protein
MGSAERLISQFKTKFLSHVISASTNALIAVLLARLLDPDGYGLFFLAISIFSTLEVATRLGIAKSAARYLSEYKEKDPSQLTHVLRTTTIFISVTTSITVIGLVIGHRWLADLIGEPELAPLLLVGALYMIVMTAVAYLRKVFQGFERIEYAAAVDAVDPLSRCVFALGFVLFGFGALGALWGYVIGLSLTSVLGIVLLYVYVYPREGASRSAEVESGLRRRIVEYSLPLTATSTASRLDKDLDTILVGFFLNPVAVSYYVIGKQTVKFIEAPVSALGFTISPTFGAQKATGDLAQASRIYETALIHSLLLYIPAAAGLVVVAEPLIVLVFGPDYLGAVPVLQVLGVYAVFLAITMITSNGLDFLGRARERAVVKGITSVLNVGLNVVLIPTIGVVGAAIATVITYGMYTLAVVYIASLEFDLRAGKVLREITTIVGVTAVMTGVVIFLLEYIQGWITLFAVVGVGILVWGVLSVLTGLLDAEKVKAVVE